MENGTFNKTDIAKNPYEDELIQEVGFLRIEDLPHYGITLEEYLNPDAEIVARVKARVEPKDVVEYKKTA